MDTVLGDCRMIWLGKTRVEGDHAFWQTQEAQKVKGGEGSGEPEADDDVTVKFLQCPITHDLMSDPVIAADGHTYERAAIEEWLQTNATSPMTNEALPHLDLIPNYLVHAQLIDFKESQAHRVSGSKQWDAA